MPIPAKSATLQVTSWAMGRTLRAMQSIQATRAARILCPSVWTSPTPAMANLTLSVDEGLLLRANARSRRLQAIDALAEVAERTNSRSEVTWTRESLHERGT